MNLDGLIRWAPESVVMKAQRTIASLDPSDRITVERLAQNWTEQLHMVLESDFTVILMFFCAIISENCFAESHFVPALSICL